MRQAQVGAIIRLWRKGRVGKYLYMTSSDLARWGGVAAMLGGALLVAKGTLIVVSDTDLSLVPAATLLLALGIAASGAEVLSPTARGVTLAVGVLWFPLQGLGFAISEGVGFIVGGLAWAVLGHVLR